MQNAHLNINKNERENKVCSVLVAFRDALGPRAVDDTASLVSRGSRANDPSSHQHRSARTHTQGEQRSGTVLGSITCVSDTARTNASGLCASGFAWSRSLSRNLDSVCGRSFAEEFPRAREHSVCGRRGKV